MNAIVKNDAAQQEVKRIYGLIDKAVKHAREASVSLQAAAAASMYQLIAYGNNTYINRLYEKLADEKDGSPKDAAALRTFFARGVLDKFGHGGEQGKNDDGKIVWIKRHVKFFDFSSSVNTETQVLKGFYLINIKNPNSNLSDHDIECIKKAKQDIIKAGEDALNFMWVSAAQEAAMAKAWSLDDVQKSATTLLMNAARNAPKNGISVDKLMQAGAAFGLESDKLTKVREAHEKASKPAVKEAKKQQENTNAKDGKGEELIPPASRGKPTGTAEQAHA